MEGLGSYNPNTGKAILGKDGVEDLVAQSKTEKGIAREGRLSEKEKALLGKIKAANRGPDKRVLVGRPGI